MTDKFFIACSGIALILGFIAFGYILYQWIGYYTFLPTCLFAGSSIVGINVLSKEKT